jgi:hypothetical protein
MFDKLLLLSEGRLVFFSDTKNIEPWFRVRRRRH